MFGNVQDWLHTFGSYMNERKMEVRETLCRQKIKCCSDIDMWKEWCNMDDSKS
jgi:hypothetical protein